MEGLVRLNLGSGAQKWDGFINCDRAGNWSQVEPDVDCDIRKLPFPDEYADEVHAIHVIEHFHRLEVNDVLQEWRRVLKPNGKLVLECPCLDKIMEWLPQKPRNERWYRLTLVGLYGEHNKDEPEMVHHWCYSSAEMTALLQHIGFQKVQILKPMFHQPARDMRAVARK